MDEPEVLGDPLDDLRSTHAGLTSQRTSAAGSVQSRHNSVTSQHTARSNGSHVSYRSDVKVFDGRGGGAGEMRFPLVGSDQDYRVDVDEGFLDATQSLEGTWAGVADYLFSCRAHVVAFALAVVSLPTP